MDRPVKPLRRPGPLVCIGGSVGGVVVVGGGGSVRPFISPLFFGAALRGVEGTLLDSEGVWGVGTGLEGT